MRRGLSYGLEYDSSPTDCIGENLRSPGAVAMCHRTGASATEPLSEYEVMFDSILWPLPYSYGQSVAGASAGNGSFCEALSAEQKLEFAGSACTQPLYTLGTGNTP